MSATAVYPSLPLGVTEQIEYDHLARHLPWLFVPERGSCLLYVGANQLRPPFHAQRLKAAGWHLHLLEVFASNLEHQRHLGLWDSMTMGDVTRDPLPAGLFDCVLWWHGVEHISQDALAPTLARLEGIAPRVVLGCPNGHSPQAAVYGNAYERHQWDVRPNDLAALGYTVVAYDATGADRHTRHHLLAWKGGD